MGATHNILGSSEALLVSYARRQEICEAWIASMRYHALGLGILWTISVLLRVYTLWLRSPVPLMDKAAAASFAVTSLVFMAIMLGILHVSVALSMIIDSYTAQFDNTTKFKLDYSVYEWNLLQAILRKVSVSVQKSFLVLQSTALTMVLLAGSNLYRGDFRSGASAAAWLCSSATLVVGVVFIFFKAAGVSERCMRMPALINSLDFGKQVDTRRHFLVEFISYSGAGFYVGEVRLTTAIAIKLTYFGCVVAFAIITQLYYKTGEDS